MLLRESDACLNQLLEVPVSWGLLRKRSAGGRPAWRLAQLAMQPV